MKDILLNQEVYFGEIWGKHSEVYGDMSEDTFEIIEDSEKIEKFLNTYPNRHDYNHSFIYTIIDSAEEKLEWEQCDLDENDLTQDDIDEIYELIK